MRDARRTVALPAAVVAAIVLTGCGPEFVPVTIDASVDASQTLAEAPLACGACPSVEIEMDGFDQDDGFLRGHDLPSFLSAALARDAATQAQRELRLRPLKLRSGRLLAYSDRAVSWPSARMVATLSEQDPGGQLRRLHVLEAGFSLSERPPREWSADEPASSGELLHALTRRLTNRVPAALENDGPHWPTLERVDDAWLVDGTALWAGAKDVTLEALTADFPASRTELHRAHEAGRLRRWVGASVMLAGAIWLTALNERASEDVSWGELGLASGTSFGGLALAAWGWKAQGREWDRFTQRYADEREAWLAERR